MVKKLPAKAKDAKASKSAKMSKTPKTKGKC